MTVYYDIDEYYFFDPSLVGEYPTVMEIGTFSTTAARTVLEMHPTSRIILVEAEEASADKLKKKCERDMPSVTVLHRALVAVDGPIAFNLYTSRNANSIFDRRRQLRETVTVPGRCLQTLLDEAEIYRLDRWRMNCEGAEIHALQDLIDQPSLRERIGQICVANHRSKIYKTHVWNQLLKALEEFYTIKQKKINSPFYLLRPHKDEATQ